MRPLHAAMGLLALGAALLTAPPGASAALTFTVLPHLVDESAVAESPAKFSATAAFPGEEFVGFEWSFEEGKPSINNRYFNDAAADLVTYTFKEPGDYTITCIAYHGWKSGMFGVGPYKYKRVEKFDIEVLPKLPLTIGVLTINGTGITKNEDDGTYEIKGPSSINTLVQIENGVTVDLEKKTVKFNGTLDVPLAGKFKDVLSSVGDITIDATNGDILEASLPNLEPEFEINGIKIKFSSVKLLAAGVEFDFEFTVPRFSENDPGRCPEVPGGDPPTEEDEDNEEDPDDLIQVTLKQVRIDNVSPFIHVGSAATVKLSNLSIPRTNWGLEEFELGYEVEPKEKFFGTINICFPSERSLGGTFEIVDGELEKLGFTASANIPIYTFSGGLGDAIFLKQISAELSGLSGDDPNPVVKCGEFDDSGAVSSPGIKLTWGVGLPAAGAVEEIVTLNGACEFDALWNISVGGSLVFLEEEFEDRFRVASVRGRYQSRDTGGIWSLTGLLEFDGKLTLQGVLATSFAPEDAYVIARANGAVTLPEDHWAARFVPTGSGDVVLMFRASPLDRRIVGFRLTFNVPVLGEKGTAFQFNFVTGEYAFDLDEDVVAALGAGKAESKSATLTGGQGASGLVVRLTSETGTPAFNLRRPDGSLLTPQSVDNVASAYAQDAAVHQAVYLVADAADGTYTAEFDDAGLGVYKVTFLLPRAAPTLAVTGPAADATVGRYDAPRVLFDATGFDTTAPVRVYLESTTEAGRRHNVGGAASLSSGDLAMNLSKVPPGTWRASVEIDDPDGVPSIALGTATLTVVEHLGIDVTKGALNDLATRGKDSFTASGSLALTGAAPAKLFDPATESMTLTLGGGASPYVLNVPAGSPGWKVSPKGALSWKSAKGALPKVTFKLDPVKRTFAATVKSLDFRNAQANPVGVDLVLGDDHASETSAWTVVAGKGFKLP